MRRRHLAAPLLSFLSLACGTGESAAVDGAWTTTVDTLDGGPILVVNTPPETESAPWRFEEIYRIGGGAVEGPSSFSYIAQISVDSRDRLAVLDGGARELRIFGPDGAHLSTPTAQGEGPGELAQPLGVIAVGDDLLVPDYKNQRVSVFRADSGFVGSYPMRFFQYGNTGWDAIVDSAGRVGLLSFGGFPKSGQVVRWYDRSMGPVDTMFYRASEDRPSLSWAFDINGGRMFIAIPLTGSATEVLDRGGRIWRPDEAGQYRLKQFLPPSDTLRVVEVRRPREAIPVAERDSVIENLRETLRKQKVNVEPDWSRVPEQHPGIQELSRSEDGDLWVRTSPRNRSPTRYDVLDPDGRYKGTVSIPGRVKSGVEPFVRGDQVWVVVLDDLDVETVLHGKLVAN